MAGPSTLVRGFDTKVRNTSWTKPAVGRAVETAFRKGIPVVSKRGMTYTAWGTDGKAHTLVEGEQRPRFEDGALQADCTDLIWRIEADSWDAACRQYHELQGWAPYVP
jgi:hypothetical protein